MRAHDHLPCSIHAPARASAGRCAAIGAGALILAGGLLGCGGGAGKSGAARTTPAPTISKTEFTARANAICGAADPALASATARIASHPSKAELTAIVMHTFVPSIENQVSQIKALGMPAGGQSTVTRMLTLVEADLSKVKRDPALMATDAFGDFARVAHPYGLTACAPLS